MNLQPEHQNYWTDIFASPVEVFEVILGLSQLIHMEAMQAKQIEDWAEHRQIYTTNGHKSISF